MFPEPPQKKQQSSAVRSRFPIGENGFENFNGNGVLKGRNEVTWAMNSTVLQPSRHIPALVLGGEKKLVKASHE